MTIFPSPAALIPHTAPMVLLSGVHIHDGDHTVCVGEIVDNTPGLIDGRVSTTLCLELMAQCAAVQMGLRASGSPRVGMLVSCREMTMDSPWLHLGDAFEVEVRQLDRIEGGLTAFEGRVSRLEQTLAHARFSAYMPQSPREE